MKNTMFLKILTTLFILVSCGSPSTNESVNRLNGNTPSAQVNRFESCFPQTFTITNFGLISTEYRIGKEIGAGKSGVVLTLIKENGEESKSKVLKIISKPNRELAYADAMEETDAARLLGSNLFVETNFHSFKGIILGNSTIYVSSVVKERVHGHTLFNIINGTANARNLIDSAEKLDEAIGRFEVFKKKLSKKLAELADANLYPIDLHRDNIMYDGNRWILVDAFLARDRADLQNFFKVFNGVSRKYGEVSAILEDKSQRLTPSFFEKAIDLQMLEPLRGLNQLRAKQSYTKAG